MRDIAILGFRELLDVPVADKPFQRQHGELLVVRDVVYGSVTLARNSGLIPFPLSSMTKWKILSRKLSRIVSFTSVELAAVEFSIRSYTCIDSSFMCFVFFC